MAAVLVIEMGFVDDAIEIATFDVGLHVLQE